MQRPEIISPNWSHMTGDIPFGQVYPGNLFKKEAIRAVGVRLQPMRAGLI
jgi:hypothetical protein